MNKWEKNDDWRREYEEYINSLENENCINNDCHYGNSDYYEKLDAVKTIIESMTIIEEGIHFISDENINVKWIVDDMELKIDNIDPEKDTLCISLHIKPMRSKKTKYRKENIIYFYEIQNNYISRNLIYSSRCSSIFDNGEKVLKELFDVLEIFLTQ